MNDSDEHGRRFRDAVHELANTKTHPWKCLNCGKENQGDRNHCWKCSAKQDGTPSEGSEKYSAEARARIAPTWSTPAPEPEVSASESEGVEVKALMRRYWDAYVVARATVGLGEVSKLVAVILAALIALGALLIAGQSGGGEGILIFFIGVIGATLVGGLFYILGVLIMAQGQILKASLDSAVNTSTFLHNEQRAKIMSLR